MSCNCNSITPCLNCQSGIQCNCPPVYPIPNVIVPCACCPPGYVSQAPTTKWPNGYCTDTATGKIQIALIPCVVCEEATTTDCVFYNGQIPLTCNPSGINPGDSVTTIINKLCFSSKQNIMALLGSISLDQELYDGFCNLVGGCGSSPGSTVPIIGSISWTIP